MKQLKFMEDSLFEVSRPYYFKFFKGRLPQILIGPFLNNLNQIQLIRLKPGKPLFGKKVLLITFQGMPNTHFLGKDE